MGTRSRFEIDIIVAAAFVRYVDTAHLRAIARKTLRAERAPAPLSLSIVIVGDAEMREYNRRFHGTDGTTDVLAFPATLANHLGDVIICYETARDSSQRAGWRVRDELELLVVHGVLHLLGYDDKTLTTRTQMWGRQEQILNKEIR